MEKQQNVQIFKHFIDFDMCEDKYYSFKFKDKYSVFLFKAFLGNRNGFANFVSKMGDSSRSPCPNTSKTCYLSVTRA